MTIFFPHFKLIPSPRWERGGEDLLTRHFSNELLSQKRAVASTAIDSQATNSREHRARAPLGAPAAPRMEDLQEEKNLSGKQDPATTGGGERQERGGTVHRQEQELES